MKLTAIKRIGNLRQILGLALMAALTMTMLVTPLFNVSAVDYEISPGNFIIVNANEGADTASRTSLPTVTGSFSGIPSGAEAIAFFYDYRNMDGINGTYGQHYDSHGIFIVDINTGSGTTCIMEKWSWGHDPDVKVNKYTVGPHGYSVDKSFHYWDGYQPNPKEAGYIVIPIARLVEKGIDVSDIRSISFSSAEWAWGGNLDGVTVSHRALGYIMDVEQFENDFSDLMNYTHVMDLIHSIHTPVAMADADIITAARTAYDKLNAYTAPFVTNYNSLVYAEEAFADLGDYAGVIDKINAIGNDVLSLEVAMRAYDRLDSSVTGLVSNYNKLTQAIESFIQRSDPSEAAEMLSYIVQPVMTDSRSIVAAVRSAYEKFTARQKLGFSAQYDILLDAELQLSELFPSQVNSIYEGNYTVIGTGSSTAFGVDSNYLGITGNMSSLTGDFASIPSTAKALAFSCDYTEAINKGSEAPKFWMGMRTSDGLTWTIASNHAEGTPYLDCGMSQGGVWTENTWAWDSYRPSAGAQGYVILPITPEFIAQHAPEGFDIRKVTEIGFTNQEWVYGADFRGKTVHLKDLGYINDPDKFTSEIKDYFMQRKGYNKVVSKISNLEYVYESSKTNIDAIKELYKNLDASSKFNISNYNDFLHALITYEDLFDADGVRAKINAIGTVTAAKNIEIEEALTAYLALGDSVLNQITNYSVLTDSVAAWAQIVGASGLDAYIAGIPQPLTIENRAKCELARRAYKSLSADSQAETANLDILTELESDLEKLLQPVFYGKGNYTVIGHNYDANTQFGGPSDVGQFPYGLPSLFGDFSAIPHGAQALVFAFDFSDSVNTGFYDARFNIGLRSGSREVWNLSYDTKEKPAPKFHMLYVGANGYGESITGPGIFYSPKAQSVGYLVMEFPADFWNSMSPSIVDFNLITELSFLNVEWAYGYDLFNSSASFRDLGYISDIQKFLDDVHMHYLLPHEVFTQTDDGIIKVENDKIEGDSAQFSWNAFNGAFGYYVNVYGENGRFITNAFTKEASFNYGPLEFNTAYKIQILAVDADLNPLSFSNVVSFRTLIENTQPYMLGFLESDNMSSSGYLIEGTTVTVFWKWVKGVAVYEAHLYEMINGKPVYIGRQRAPDEIGYVTFLLLSPNKEYAVQIVAYDITESVIFAYKSDFFNLKSASTYKFESNNDEDEPLVSGNIDTDGTDDGDNGEYVWKSVGKTLIDNTALDSDNTNNENGSEAVIQPGDPGGVWKTIYGYELDKKALIILIASIASAVLACGLAVFIILIIRKKKKTEIAV